MCYPLVTTSDDGTTKIKVIRHNPLFRHPDETVSGTLPNTPEPIWSAHSVTVIRSGDRHDHESLTRACFAQRSPSPVLRSEVASTRDSVDMSSSPPDAPLNPEGASPTSVASPKSYYVASPTTAVSPPSSSMTPILGKEEPGQGSPSPSPSWGGYVPPGWSG